MMVVGLRSGGRQDDPRAAGPQCVYGADIPPYLRKAVQP